MKITTLAALLLLTGRVGAEALQSADVTLEPSGATEVEALRGTVLVWADAALYTEMTDGATLHAARLDRPRKDSIGEVFAMHVVSAAKDGFVEVEPAELDCTSSQLQTTDDLARVHVFVRRADLAPVLTTAFTKTFADGTRIALEPGVPVLATASGRFVVGLRSGALSVELPATAVGHAYSVKRSKPAAAIAGHEYAVAPGKRVVVGDRAIELGGVVANAADRRGDTTLLSIQMRCAALDVTAPTSSVREVDDDDDDTVEAGSGLGVLDLRDHDYIPAGTVLATPSGHAIAVAAKPIYLMATPHGKTACVDRRMRVAVVGADALAPTGDDDKLRVCAPAGRVIHEHWRSASSANGTTGR